MTTTTSSLSTLLGEHWRTQGDYQLSLSEVAALLEGFTACPAAPRASLLAFLKRSYPFGVGYVWASDLEVYARCEEGQHARALAAAR